MRRLALVLALLSVLSGCASKSSTVAAPQPSASPPPPPPASTPAPIAALETSYYITPRLSPRAQCFQKRDGSAWRPTARECESMSP
jgi:hypothetical protein